jgi:hypothetical protein
MGVLATQPFASGGRAKPGRTITMPVPIKRCERGWGTRALAAALVLAAASLLAGCASTVADYTPNMLGGLPAEAPQRPAKPHVYPAVNDLPPPRPDPMLSAEEQKRLEDDLMAARERNSAAADATGSTRKP